MDCLHCGAKPGKVSLMVRVKAINEDAQALSRQYRCKVCGLSSQYSWPPGEPPPDEI